MKDRTVVIIASLSLLNLPNAAVDAAQQPGEPEVCAGGAGEGCSNYSRAAAPVVAPMFMPLPPGQVEPAGWLRDWAVTMRNGITGHLDERNPVYSNGWKGVGINWTCGNADGTGWPLEQSAYWLDGAIRLGYILHDQALIDRIRARLDPIVDGVNSAKEGTSFIYWKPDYKPQGFDNWAHSQMGRALVALYQGSGEKKVLDALAKVYSAYSSDLGPIDFADVRGICNLDAMMETYSYTGDKRILERANAALGRPDVKSLIRNWSEGRVDCGHMVITYENIRIPAVMYSWTGDAVQLKATEGAFQWLDKNHMMPYGLASGEESAAGVGAGRKTEACNIPAMLHSANWMYRITGDGAWGDRMEKAFFNAGPAPLARDCSTAAYYQAPNRIKLGHIPVESQNPGNGGISFGPLAASHVLCCIGAVNRIMPYFMANMWMATGDGGLAATLYGPCTVNAKAGEGTKVKITCNTDYPFNESISMKIEPEKKAEFPIYLRMPVWCKTAEVEVNGRRIKAEPVDGRKGFVRISRKWRKGDVVTLKLPMTVSVARGTEGPYPEQVRGYFGQINGDMFKPRALPYASVHYGPLLFCLPIPDKNENTPDEGARWQYALNLRSEQAVGMKVERMPMPKQWNWPLVAPLSLTVPACSFDWKPDINHALPEKPIVADKPDSIRLIPYGCAKFQVSMLPVTEHTWEGKKGEDRIKETEFRIQE